jgi:deoxyribose-phosphate aldolase
MLMLENATPLPVKAAGGVRTYDEAVEMIKLGGRGLLGQKQLRMEEIQMWDTNFTIKKQYEKSLFALVLSFFSSAIRKTAIY